MDIRSRRTRRRLTFASLLRTGLTTACLLAVYFAAPLNRAFTPMTAVALVAALAALGVLIVWQARAIVRSPSPPLRTVEALATCVPPFLLAFAACYCLMGHGAGRAFSEPLTHVDALYFTMTVFSSVGFGDIVPLSQAARALTMVQMIGDLVILGLVAKVLVEAMRRGVERQARGTDGNPRRSGHA
ncbi:two pore domain potassium channel family protein [Actinomadura sp. KC216]|uniref:potassium channel family protein n=1 Tax=Actinomadura sp. KC216 TaxID=2530370 RepID=UPI00104A8180|nr:potassium channel family protein [Actinomadura sp. KC216]TDB80856.1 two pore domain potassium channel family protein [Actinomadura sp. KC216]